MIQAIPTPTSPIPSGGAVGGASNLTTVGAVPYVSASGVLNQDVPAFSWDSAADRLSIFNITAYNSTAITGSTLAVVRAGAGQSGTLQEWQNNAGTALASVSSTGGITTAAGVTASGSVSAAGNIFAGSTFGLYINTDTAWLRDAAGVFAATNGTAGTYRDAKMRTLIGGGTAPSVSSGSIVTGSTNIAGQVNSATTGTFTCVITFTSTAPNGWSIAPQNLTTANLIRQTASSTTTATIVGVTVSGDVISYVATAF